ncbi:MAG: DUF523 domain-containing protein [Deltaproteobacteria bacterium]|nr:DUF523 domain-containing protein [Deltaproteobacteria bacterium]
MNSNSSPILISACLVGINCRHDGTNAMRKKLIKQYSKERLIPICPEQLGGLPTPRPRAEINPPSPPFRKEGNKKKNCKVIDMNDRDVTKEFIHGAEEALQIAKLFNIKKALLKEKSPSCGVRFIYKSGKLVIGMGVTARLLKDGGIEVAGVE